LKKKSNHRKQRTPLETRRVGVYSKQGRSKEKNFVKKARKKVQGSEKPQKTKPPPTPRADLRCWAGESKKKKTKHSLGNI